MHSHKGMYNSAAPARKSIMNRHEVYAGGEEPMGAITGGFGFILQKSTLILTS